VETQHLQQQLKLQHKLAADILTNLLQLHQQILADLVAVVLLAEVLPDLVLVEINI